MFEKFHQTSESEIDQEKKANQAQALERAQQLLASLREKRLAEVSGEDAVAHLSDAEKTRDVEGSAFSDLGKRAEQFLREGDYLDYWATVQVESMGRNKESGQYDPRDPESLKISASYLDPIGLEHAMEYFTDEQRKKIEEQMEYKGSSILESLRSSPRPDLLLREDRNVLTFLARRKGMDTWEQLLQKENIAVSS